MNSKLHWCSMLLSYIHEMIVWSGQTEGSQFVSWWIFLLIQVTLSVRLYQTLCMVGTKKSAFWMPHKNNHLMNIAIPIKDRWNYYSVKNINQRYIDVCFLQMLCTGVDTAYINKQVNCLKQKAVFNPFNPTDHFSSIQHKDWKSPIKLLSVERVKP